MTFQLTGEDHSKFDQAPPVSPVWLQETGYLLDLDPYPCEDNAS